MHGPTTLTPSAFSTVVCTYMRYLFLRITFTRHAGSGALKTDFTRTGTRTFAGMLRDGVNSLQRYYLNNYADGFNQVIEILYSAASSKTHPA
jgi:hypothetical protein